MCRRWTTRIFNWMHSKLYPSVKYSHVSEKKDVFGGDERENMEISNGMIEEEALLLHDVLHGILAIGTLGRKVSFVSQSYCSEEDEIPVGDKMNVETDVEVKDKNNGAALTLAASKPPALIEFDLKLPVAVEEKKMEMVAEDRETAEKIQELPLLMEDKEKREQRVTLADLFAADASTMNDLDENPNQKMNVRSKQYLIIHNNKVQNSKEAKWQSDTAKGNANNPTRKLQKLITKLLKKKVHPEMDAKKNVADMQMKKSRKPLMPGGAKSIGKSLSLSFIFRLRVSEGDASCPRRKRCKCLFSIFWMQLQKLCNPLVAGLGPALNRVLHNITAQDLKFFFLRKSVSDTSSKVIAISSRYMTFKFTDLNLELNGSKS